MPISELIRDRKISPDQLAFPLAGEGAGSRSTTYQQTLSELRQTDVTYVTNIESNAQLKKEVKARTEAERRANAYVGNYHNVAEYDLNATATLNMSAYHPMPFLNGVITSPAIIQYNDGTAAGVNTMLRPSKNLAGVWWIYSHMKIAFTSGMNVTEVRLAILKNGALYRIVDSVDTDYAGDNAAYILDGVVGGGCHVPLDHGEYAQVALYCFNGGGGTQSFMYPGSIDGYMTAHREMCHTDTATGSPTDGSSYVFQ